VVTLAVTAVGLMSLAVTTPQSIAVERSQVTAPSTSGTIRLAITGLSASTAPLMTVTGPAGFARTVRARSIMVPRSGTYRVTVGAVRSGVFLYRASVASRSVNVVSGRTVSPAFTYRRVAPVTTTGRYALGTFTGVELWVDPVHGSNSRGGHTRATALATVGEAWRRIPMSTTLTTGYRINVVRGTYPASVLVNYWENRWGTATAPIVIRSVDGSHAARFTGDINAYNVRHFYVIGIDIVRPGDAFHCEKCSYVVLRNMHLSGVGGAHETVKVNQSDHIYIEDSDIHGADDNAIDFVAVNKGHIVGNRIHGAQDWCAYVKGGSASISVIDNEIFDCGTGGFTAGQGTGFEFMVAPYLHYEAYGIRVVGNLIHDTEGAGLGINGGYNVLMAFNTLYRVGSRSHAVEFVQGGRSCDAANAGDSTAPCAARRAAGGWGTTDAGGQWIPNRHIYFVNNVVANPRGFSSQWSHFDVHSPATPPAGSGVSSPARADDDLVIRGNVFLNGNGSLDLGFNSDACTDSNPGCNPTYVRAHNVFGPSTRVFRDPAHSDYRLLGGSAPLLAVAVSVPAFGWADRPTRPAVPVSTWTGPAIPTLTHPGAWRIA